MSNAVFNVTCLECGAVRQATTNMIGRRVRCECGAEFAIKEKQYRPERLLEVNAESVGKQQKERAARGRTVAISVVVVALMIVLVTLCFSGLPEGVSIQLDTPLQAISLKSDPDKVAIETWLRENTPTGEWEEIEWMEPRPVPGYRELSVCRIKYRTENTFGGMSVDDHLFLKIGNDKWSPFLFPGSLSQGSGYFEKIRKLYFIAMSIDETLVSEIDAYQSGSDAVMRDVAIENAEEKWNEVSR